MTQVVIIDPISCAYYPTKFTEEDYTHFVEMCKEVAENRAPTEEVELAGHVLVWSPIASEGRARWGWYDPPATEADADAGRTPDRKFAGMAILFGPRNPETGRFTDVTMTRDELSARLGWDARRAMVAALVRATMPEASDDDGECQCEACQMDRKATHATPATAH